MKSFLVQQIEQLEQNRNRAVEQLSELRNAIQNVRVLRYTSTDDELKGFRVHLFEKEWDKLVELLSEHSSEDEEKESDAFGFNQHYYRLFDIRPVLEDGIWIATGPAKRLGYVIANKDIFVLLEINQANGCQYPKVLTTTGLVGYLYLHNDNEGLEKVEQ